MPEQHLQAGEVDEAEEVLDVVFPSGDESAEVVHPGEEPFHLPTSLVAPQLASVLRLSTPAAIRRDQLDAVFLFKFFIEPIRVVRFVPNESGGQLVEEASSQDFFDQLAFVRRSTLHRYGERKTVTSGDSVDLRPLPRRVGPTPKPPFSRSRRSRRRRPLPTSTCLAVADAAPAVAAPLPICPNAPTAGNDGGKSGRADTSPAARATVRPCRAPTTRRSIPSACHATDGRGCRTAAPASEPARQSPIVLRSTPSVLPSAHAETHRASPECTIPDLQMFMRLVLGLYRKRPLRGSLDHIGVRGRFRYSDLKEAPGYG